MTRKTMKIVLICSLVLFACGSKEQTKQSATPDFTLYSLDGEEYVLSAFKGQVVILDFWATWCPPCRNSIPTFARLHNKYNDQGLVILGIGLDDEQSLASFRNQMQIPYPILVGNNEIAKAYEVSGIPKTIFMDKKGKIRKTQVGFAPELEAQFDHLVDSLLKE